MSTSFKSTGNTDITCDFTVEMKQKFISNCTTLYRPFYVRAVEMFGKSALQAFTTLFLLAFLPYVFWIILVSCSGHSAIISQSLYTLYGPVTMFVGVAFLCKAYYLLLGPNRINDVLGGICDDTGMKEHERWIKVMFYSRMQSCFIVVMTIILVANSIAFFPAHAIEIQTLPLWVNLYWWLYVGYITVFLAPGLWLALTTMLWIKSYVSPTCIRIQALRPQRNVALQTVGSIVSTYALMFSIESSIGLSGFFAFHLSNFSVVNVIRNVWLIICIPVMILFFAYPQYLIRKTISIAKKAVIADIGNKIDKLYYNDALSTEGIDRIIKYLALEEKLSSVNRKEINIEIAYKFLTAISTLIVVIIKQLDNGEMTTYLINSLQSFTQRVFH